MRSLASGKRSRVDKGFRLRPDEIKPIAQGFGACYASDRISVDGCPVGYAYRERADFDGDSGWRFFSGDESQAYADDPANFELFDVNTIANYDSAIVPHLDSAAPVELERKAPGDPLRRVG
jgi:hypothetical protein